MTRWRSLVAAIVFPFALLLNPAFAGKRDSLAGAVVRSDEYIVRRKPYKVEEFIGNVSYHGSGKDLHSDWARFNHRSRLWEARGNVSGVMHMKDGSILHLWGDRGDYDLVTEKGWLKEKDVAHPIRFDDDEGALHDQGLAHRLEWDRSQSRAWAFGDVHTWGDHGESWSEVTEYHNPEKLVILTRRRPVTVHHEKDWDGAIQGERIRAFQDQHRLEADDHVVGWILFRNYPKDKSKH